MGLFVSDHHRRAMARCLPYIRPEIFKYCGAAAAASVIGPSVGSIKLQSERKDREQKKEEKKKKKEKKREKDRKEKSKGLHDKSQQTQYQSKKRKHDEMGQLNDEDDHHAKTSDHAMEPFEKSGLTEENGLSSLMPKPGDFSDSTQDSTKRKKLTDPSFSHKNGCVFRLKLSQKHKDELPPRCEQPCVLQTQPLQKHSDLLVQSIRESGTTSTDEPCVSGRVAEAPLLQRHQKQDEQNQEQILPTSNDRHLSSDLIMEQTHEVAGKHSRSEKRSRNKSKEKKIQLRESIPNWNLPPLQQYEDENIGDQDWLFQTRAKWAPSSENCCRTSISEVRDDRSGMTSLQPQAQYLPQFNICALPFVVPF